MYEIHFVRVPAYSSKGVSAGRSKIISDIYSFLDNITQVSLYNVLLYLAFSTNIIYNVIMRKLIVDENYNKKKLNNFILDKFPNLSFNTLNKALRKKDIKINGKRISENLLIHTGDEITIFISDELLFPTVDKKLDIIYEDDHICIINKPAGIEVTGDNSLESISGYLPCHRLDRNTSGLVVFAKDKYSLEILLEKFKHHEIEKHYICKVVGIPKKNKDNLEAYLFKDTKKSQVYIYDTFRKGCQKIKTSYQVIDSDTNNNTSLLEVQLHTGRTHQIRAHLTHIGHPIIGDGKYGINKINKDFKQKTQLLCAYKLQFIFSTDANILNYLNNKTFKIKPTF